MIAGLVAVLAVAACGSSGSSSGGSSGSATSASTGSATSASTGSATSASSGSATGSSTTAAAAPTTGAFAPVAGESASAVKSAQTAGVKAAGKEGAAVKVPTETIGLVNVTAESEAAQRIQQGAVDAVKAMGWKITTVDAQGDPAKSESAMMSFVNQHVSAILDLSNPTSAINQSLIAAKAKNIPVIDIGGLQDPSPDIEAQFAVNETDFSKALDKYILAHVKNGSKVAEFSYPLLLSERLRDEQFHKDTTGKLDVVANHQVNFAALTSDTQDAARTFLSANPDLAAIWGDTDSEMPAVAQILKAANACGKVQNYNFYDDLANLAAIRSGCATAVVASPVGADGWAAVDSLAEMFARKKPISSLPTGWDALSSTYGVQIRNGSAIQVINKSNLPPAGQYVTPKVDYVEFFESKWKKEFGK